MVISEIPALATLPSRLIFESGILSPSLPSLPAHLTPGGTMSHFLSFKLVAKLPLLSLGLGVGGVIRALGGRVLPGRLPDRRKTRVTLCPYTRVRC